MSYIIPDVSASVSQLQVYENALIRKLRFESAFKHHEHGGHDMKRGTPSVVDRERDHRFNPYQQAANEEEEDDEGLEAY